MDKMKLHWSPRSPFVRKVMIAAHELGVQGLLERQSTTVLMREPNVAYLSVNPLGKIPALVLPDDQVLIDSGVICEYLDSLSGDKKLLPEDAKSRSLALSSHALINGLLDLLVLWKNERSKPLAKQTPEWLHSFEFKFSKALSGLEKGVKPFSDESLDLSSITLGCLLWYLDFRFEDIDWRNDNSKLAVWYESFKQLPSVLATEKINYEE